MGKKILSANLLEIFFLCLKWAEKNILLALCALKIIVFVDKKYCRDNLSRIFVMLCCAANKNILTPKKRIAPPPPQTKHNSDKACHEDDKCPISFILT